MRSGRMEKSTLIAFLNRAPSAGTAGESGFVAEFLTETSLLELLESDTQCPRQ